MKTISSYEKKDLVWLGEESEKYYYAVLTGDNFNFTDHYGDACYLYVNSFFKINNVAFYKTNKEEIIHYMKYKKNKYIGEFKGF